jgi:molybdopterin molybdotransferase
MNFAEKEPDATAPDASVSCCDDHAGYVSVESARKHALEGAAPIRGQELIALHSARGRIAKSNVFARHAVPPFNQSAMDGYAVRTCDFANDVATFPVEGRQAAGLSFGRHLTSGPAAFRIFTGAPTPEDFDAVVMQEHCTQRGVLVTVSKRPQAGDNIRLLGEDVAAGAVVLSAGTRIDARHIALLAAAGVPSVRVSRRVRVAVISTGNELREPQEHLALGEVHDCNRAMLLSLLDDSAVDLTDLGLVPDQPATIADSFMKASCKFDVIISTGGMSVGEEDHLRSAVTAAGGVLSLLKASIKPGKPASVGNLGDAILVGLPGNPVSALVTFLWFARPIVMRRAGLSTEPPRPVPAVAGFDETRKPGRDEFVPVVVSGLDANGQFVLEKPRPRGSARLSSLLDTDGLARIPGSATIVARGQRLDLYRFEGQFSL